MEEIDRSNSLKGLSKEEVVEILGEPAEIYKNDSIYKYDDMYIYYAGYIYHGLIFGHRNFWTSRHCHVLQVRFDESNKVKSTIIQEDP